ncbi:monocarboxylate transporter 13-like [Tubulanus polymorphus]|uniref:monocarboxylate transporter 13-like n=1 Tax=Tubulanus polymorphus TaxID=672921 RepID=UPI003DA327B5
MATTVRIEENKAVKCEFLEPGYTNVSWIGVSTAVALIFSPVAGVVIRRFGLRRCLVSSAIVGGSSICSSAFSTKLWQIYFLWFVAGLAHSFQVGPIMAYVLIRFRRHRSIANAFVMSAVPLGTLIFGVIINTLLEVYTWRGTVLITGALALNVIPCSLVLRKWNKLRRKEDVLLESEENTQIRLEKEKKTDKPKERCSGCITWDSEVLKLPAFMGILFQVFFIYIAVSIIYIHMVSGFTDICKLDLESARYLVPYFGASNTVARFIVSIISQHPRIDTFTLFLIVNVLLSVTVAIIPVFEGFTAAVVLVVIIGIGMSAFSGLTHLVVADIIEYRYLHMAVQYMLLPSGIGYMVGAPLAGLIFDATGNYIYSFELTAVLVAVSVLIMIPFWVKHIRSLSSENSHIL